jgi:hypothetical protein
MCMRRSLHIANIKVDTFYHAANVLGRIPTLEQVACSPELLPFIPLALCSIPWATHVSLMELYAFVFVKLHSSLCCLLVRLVTHNKNEVPLVSSLYSGIALPILFRLAIRIHLIVLDAELVILPL